MNQDRSFAKLRRSGSAALVAALALGLSLGPVSMATAQTPAEVELAQVSALTSTVVSLINALPTTTGQEIFEAQIAAAIEAAGISGELGRRALLDVLKVRGIPAAAVAAIRSLLAKGAHKRSLGTASLDGGGGPTFTDSFGGGGSSDY